MSGEAPLRYESPLNWPLVPPLADDDDDSVELPSTVDVNAIWDLPQPGDGSTRLAPPATASSTQLSSPTAEPAAPSSPHTEPRPPQLPPLLPPHSPHSPPPSSSLKPSRSATPSPPPPQSPAQSKALDMPTPIPMPPPTSMSAVAISLASSPPSPPLRASPQLLLPPPPSHPSHPRPRPLSPTTRRTRTSAKAPQQSSPTLTSSLPSPPSPPSLPASPPPPSPPSSPTVASSSLAAATSRSLPPPRTASPLPPPPRIAPSSQSPSVPSVTPPPTSPAPRRLSSSPRTENPTIKTPPAPLNRKSSPSALTTAAAKGAAAVTTTLPFPLRPRPLPSEPSTPEPSQSRQRPRPRTRPRLRPPPQPPQPPPPLPAAVAAAAAMTASTTTPGTPSPSPAPPTPLSSSPTPRTETPATMQQPPRLAPPALPPSSSRSPHPKPHQSQPRPPPPTATAADAVTPLPRFPLTSISKQLVPQPPSKYLLSPSTPLAAFPRRSSPQRSSASFRSARQASRSPRPASPSSSPGTASATTSPPVSRSLLSRATTPSTGSRRQLDLAVGKHVHSSSDGDESDIDSDSWSSGSGGRDSDSDSGGWSDKSDSATRDGAAALPAQRTRESPQSSVAESRRSPAAGGQVSAPAASPAARRRTASADSSSTAAASGGRLSGGSQRTEPSPVRSPRLSGDRRQYSRPRPRPRPQPAGDPQQTSGAPPAGRTRTPTGETGRHNQHLPTRTTADTVSPKGEKTSPQSSQLRSVEARNVTVSFPTPCSKANDGMSLSGSDDSEFDVGGVRAAIQSLDDDAETAERVTTPEKQTWWKNKLKHSAMGRAESAHGLVRPWETRREAGKANARHPSGQQSTTKAPTRPAAATDNGPRVGRSEGEKQRRVSVRLSESSEDEEEDSSPVDVDKHCDKIVGGVSPQCAMPVVADSHVRKPSLSVILNLENKNSLLRGACPMRGDNYEGAPKLPHQLRSPDVRPPLSRPRGRLKPSESAPPPRAAELMAPPSSVPAAASEPCDSPASCNALTLPGNRDEGGREGGQRPSDNVGPEARTSRAGETMVDVQESAGDGSVTSQSPQWPDERGSLTAGGMSPADPQQRQPLAEFFHSPRSYHGSPASLSSFSSAATMITDATASDVGATVSVAPNPFNPKADAADSETGDSTQRGVQSIILSRRRRLKLLKRKHKNIVDPVLLADVEEVVQRVSSLMIGRGASRQSDHSANARTATCFQTKKYGRKRKVPLEKMVRTDREMADEHDKKTGKDPPPCTQEDENKEHCLPLKKRYHHISQALAESINCVAKPPSQTATTGLCKGEQSMKDGCLALRAKEAVDEKVNKVQDAKSLEASGTAPDRVSAIGKPVISKESVRSRYVESPAKSVAAVNQSKPSLNESEGASQKPSLVTGQIQEDDASKQRRSAVSRQKSPAGESINKTAKNRISDALEESQGHALKERTKPVLPTKRKPTAGDELPAPVNHKVVDTDDAVTEVKDAARSPRKLNGGQPRRGVGSIRPLVGSGLEGRRQLRKPVSSTEPPGDPGRRRHRRRRRRHRSMSDRPSSEESVAADDIVAPLADTLDPPVPAPTPGDTIATENPPSIHEAASEVAPAIGQTAAVPTADSIQPAKLASLPVSSEASPAPPAQEETEDRTTRAPAKPSPDATGLTVQRRKRRKINRTGFPNKKKKVRPKSRQPTPEPATPTPDATPTPEVVAESPKSSVVVPDTDRSTSEPASVSTEKPDPDEDKPLPSVKPQPETETKPVDPAVAQPAPKSDVPSGRVSRELRGLRRPERPSPSAQLQQTAVVRLDKMGELPARHPAGTVPQKQRDSSVPTTATDVDSETAPVRDESTEPGESPARPAVRPTSRRPTDRKRKKPPAAVAPSKRTRVDRTDEFLMEDDIFFESDLVISESGPSSEVPSGDELHRPAVTSSTTRIAAPKWKKKKYLTAGLFSDYYKVDRESDRQELTKSRLSYEPADHEHGLLPPPCYEEKWLRQRPRDFTLPYDLWWLQANGQLPGRDTVASWNYKKLRTNYYFDVKPPPLREVEACSCRPPLDPQRPGCGEDCINRMMFVECSSSSCPCGDRCDNQRIQRHRWAPGLVKFMTGEKGWGIMTRRQIRSGTFILEYVGEIVSDKEFKRRMQTRYINDQHHYCLNLDRGLVIDGHRMGSIGRFVNHSCSPNCEMQKWEMNGLSRMALFSKQDIPAGTELTYDYNFALFNPAVGQKCHCGASECRGVIGGRSQRVGPPPQQVERCRGRAAITATTSTSTGTTSTASAASTSLGNGAGAGGNAQLPAGNGAGVGESGATRQERNSSAGSEQAGGELAGRDAVTLPVRPLSARDVRFIRLHSSFLVRNYEKMRRQREPPLEAARPASPAPAGAQEETFRAQLRALDSSRSVRTRRLAAAEEDPQMVRTLKLAHILKEIYQAVVASPGEGPGPSAIEALTLPRKPRVSSTACVSDAPASLLPEPLDISDIERHIVTGQYKTADAFDHDFRRLFTAQLRAHGRCSPVGAAVLRLKHKYAEFKTVMMSQIQEILGVVPSSFRPPAKRRQDTGLDGEEDTIRCVCNLHREEGLMIQCERCLVWQHCDCVDADPAIEKYACELCEPRHISPEVRLKPQPEDAEPDLTYYLSLMRDQLQVRQGDCVYIMQGDMVKAAQEAGKVPYTYVKRLLPDELLIFRVEKLWKDESGGRFAFGYHYCRPQETYHEPTRKFYTKEVMRSPLYEVVPLELVVGTCWVLDVNTYCKGRPVGANENSVYVCEYRVDKTARLFAKLTKNRHPICTKAFAFDSFETRLKISRTFTPHAEEVAQKLKPEKAKAKKEETSAAPAAPKVVKPKVPKEASKHAPPPPKIETPGEKARRLDGVLLRLLARMPGPPLDVSHLLDSGKRHRRRTGARL